MLLRELVKKENARLAQDAGVRLAGPVRTASEQLLSGQAPVAQLPGRCAQLLREGPAHLAAAAESDCDLRGLRLNTYVKLAHTYTEIAPQG